jgi:hypothetical protein
MIQESAQTSGRRRGPQITDSTTNYARFFLKKCDAAHGVLRAHSTLTSTIETRITRAVDHLS